METGVRVLKRPCVAVILICALLGIGNAGAVVVCFGTDGHIEMVSASEEHCCECPSHTALVETDHRCGSCFDIPLPVGSGEAFVLPSGADFRDLMDQAESRVCGRSLTPIRRIRPRPLQAQLHARTRERDLFPLLRRPLDLKTPSSIFHRSVPPFRVLAMCRLFRPVRISH